MRKIKVAVCNHQVDSAYFTCDLRPALAICKYRNEYGTKCPYLDQVSLKNTNTNSKLLARLHRLVDYTDILQGK